MTNWKTTIGGILLAIGGYFLTSDWEFAMVASGVLNAVGGLLVGGSARDFNVTSKESGAE